jgi:hypothetical protein
MEDEQNTIYRVGNAGAEVDTTLHVPCDSIEFKMRACDRLRRVEVPVSVFDSP